MLIVNNIFVNYGPVNALRGVSIEVNCNETIGVVGPNGAGKSTLLKAIMGGVTVKSGIIEFNNKHITGKASESIARMGISLVPEGRCIFNTLSVEENLKLGAVIRKSGREVKEDTYEMLNRFPVLKNRFLSRAGNLSGGEQQQLAIARALMARPKLILLDEPSLGLAPIIVDQVYETLAQLKKQNLTILLVEQNTARIIEKADRAYILRTGTVELEGSREKLLKNTGIEDIYFGFNKNNSTGEL